MSRPSTENSSPLVCSKSHGREARDSNATAISMKPFQLTAGSLTHTTPVVSTKVWRAIGAAAGNDGHSPCLIGVWGFRFGSLAFGCLFKSLDAVGFRARVVLTVVRWKLSCLASIVEDCSGFWSYNYGNPEPKP